MMRFATITATEHTGASVLAQIDQDGGQDATTPTWETVHPYGFSARPPDPATDTDGNPTAGCQALHDWDGSRGFVLPLGDPRLGPSLPAIKKGESLQYGQAGQFIRCHADGAISLFTTDDATPNGRSIFLRLSPDQGLEFSCPWIRVSCGPNGFHVLHSSGARIDLGSISGVPAPLDALASYVKIQAAMCSVMGSAVSLGTDGGAANLAAVVALDAFLATIVAAIGSASGVTPAQQAAIAAAQAAYTALSPNLGKVA